mmetsp:Transcript_130035/g.243225  ORF Transcript_130035/g.243225 Transcript_130035/m.243225 type:complete len:84 (+) Transcript_130035:2-253(+)
MSSRSMYVYLGHVMVFDKYVEYVWDWTSYMFSLPPCGQALWYLNVSFTIVMFTSSWPIYYILSSFCEPPLAWLSQRAALSSPA